MKQEIIRKLSAAVAMSLVVGVSLAACGGGSSSTAAGVTKTGSAEGFGGAVTATLTVDANGTVTDCKLEGAQETESIGGAALEELSKQVVAANGPAIDGVAGATVTTKAVRKAVAAALGVELAEEAPADSAAAAPAEPAAIVPVEGGIQIGQAYAAAHGTKCFTEAVAVVKDDVILAAYLDDFQFTSTDAGVTAVPNSDSDFAAGYAEGIPGIHLLWPLQLLYLLLILRYMQSLSGSLPQPHIPWPPLRRNHHDKYSSHISYADQSQPPVLSILSEISGVPP